MHTLTTATEFHRCLSNPQFSNSSTNQCDLNTFNVTITLTVCTLKTIQICEYFLF